MAIQWSSWALLSKPPETELGRPFVQRNQDGRLEVFAVGRGEIFNISQVSPNGAWRESWRSKGRPSSDVGVRSHVVGRNADGRLEIFAIGDDHALWQKWQVAPNSGWVDTWKSLGTPTPGPSLNDELTVGRNQDGRQEVFAIASIENFRLVFQNLANSAERRLEQLGAVAHQSRVNMVRSCHLGSLIASQWGAIKMVARNYS